MTAVLEETRLTDAWSAAERLARRKFRDSAGLVGFGVVELRGPNGELKSCEPFANKITTPGDQYYAQKAIVGISPANPSAPTAMNGMKLGTGATTPAKSGAGAALGATYISGSNVAFDSTYPQASAVAGTDTGWNAIYKTTWPAGTATNSAITEAAIVNDQATNATSTAANTAARIVFSAQNKGALDSLAITWSHTFLGA